jgi:Flp pilus assembly protein TadB
MSDNAEAGIARTQAAAAKAAGAAGLKEHHNRNIAHLDERIMVSILAIAAIGLIVLWATSSSPLVLYGSFAGVILLTVLWGLVRIKRIEAMKQQREKAAQSWQSD